MHARALVFTCFLFSAGLLWSNQGLPPKVVETITLKKKPIHQSVSLFGRIRAKLDYTHVAEADGVLDHALLAGQPLKKGDVFASLSNPDVSKTYELAKNAEKIAFEQYQRSQKLLEKKAVSHKAAEADRTQWIEAKQKSLQTKIALKKTQFKAPFDGVLGVFKKREGAYIQRGDEVVTIYNPEELVVEIDIPEKYVRDLSTSNQVMIEDKRHPLTQLQRVVDPATNAAPAFIDIGSSSSLVPGAIVSVDLVLQEKDEALAIPRESLFIEGDKNFVFVVKEDKAIKQEVTLGISQENDVEVVSGLKKGDLVVNKNPTRLMPDEAVRLFKGGSGPKVSPEGKKEKQNESEE